MVLVPRQWTIERGEQPRRTVAISPSRAIARVSGSLAFWRLTRPAPFRRAVAWATDSFPIAVSIRASPRIDLSPSDSARFWETVARFETVIGRHLLRPAARGRALDGRDNIELTIDPALPEVAETFVTYDQRGRIFDATIAFQSRSVIAEPGIVMHELMHVLGFGHTGSWRSLMSPVEDLVAPSDEDLAYAQLFLRLRAAQDRYDAPFAIAEAEAAERQPVIPRSVPTRPPGALAPR
jgi:hypothetical protein